jgi:hypothetical protein
LTFHGKEHRVPYMTSTTTSHTLANGVTIKATTPRRYLVVRTMAATADHAAAARIILRTDDAAKAKSAAAKLYGKGVRLSDGTLSGAVSGVVIDRAAR